MYRLFAIGLTATVCFGSAEAAWYGEYTKVFGGATLTPDLRVNGAKIPTDDGWNAGAAVGWHLSPGFALEVEGLYDKVRYDSAPGPENIHNWSLSANGILNLGSGWNWGSTSIQPYVGAGAGVDRAIFHYKTPALAYRISDTVPAYQLIAGLAMPINSSMDWLIEYRFRDLFDHAKKSGVVYDYQSSNINVGLRLHY